MTTDLETIGMLRESVERYCQDHYDFLQRKSRLQQPGGFSSQTWTDFAEFGFLSTCLPEAYDGLQGDAHAVAAVSEVLGQALILEPFLPSAVLAPAVLERLAPEPLQKELLPKIASGQSKLLVPQTQIEPLLTLTQGQLSGRLAAVIHGDIADGLILPVLDEQQQLVAVLIDTTQNNVTRTHYRLVDGRGAAHFEFTNCEVQIFSHESSHILQALEEVENIATAALCAEDYAITQALLSTTNEYLKVRKQFGKALAENQALQHRMADLYLLSKEAKALSVAANQALQANPVDNRTLSGARAYIIKAARKVASEAIQMHGGVGITEELIVSHYFRRLMVNATLYVSRAQHFERFAQLSIMNTEPTHV